MEFARRDIHISQIWPSGISAEETPHLESE